MPTGRKVFDGIMPGIPFSSPLSSFTHQVGPWRARLLSRALRSLGQHPIISPHYIHLAILLPPALLRMSPRASPEARNIASCYGGHQGAARHPLPWQWHSSWASNPVHATRLAYTTWLTSTGRLIAMEVALRSRNAVSGPPW